MNVLFQKLLKIKKRLLSGDVDSLGFAVKWNVIGAVFAKLSLLLISIFAARYLGPEDFGKWTFIRTNISSFSVLLGFAVAVTPLKFISSLRNKKSELDQVISFSFITSVTLGLLLCSVMIVLSSDMLGINDAYKEIRSEIIVASTFLIFISLTSFFTGSLSGYNNYKEVAKSNITSSIVGSFIIVGLIYFYGLIGLVVGYGIYYAVQSTLLSYFFKLALYNNNNKITFIIKWKSELSRFFSFSVPALVSAFIGAFSVLFLFSNASSKNDGYLAIGIFGAARIFQNIIIEFSQQFNAPLISKLSNKIGERGNSEKLNFTVPWMLSLFFVLPFVIIPELGSIIFLGSNYDIIKLEEIISITMLSTYIILYKQSINRKIISDEVVWIGALGNVVWASALFVFYYKLPIDDMSVRIAYSFLGAYLIDLMLGLLVYDKLGVVKFKNSVSMLGVTVFFVFIAGFSLNAFNAGILERLTSIILIFSFIIIKFARARL